MISSSSTLCVIRLGRHSAICVLIISSVPSLLLPVMLVEPVVSGELAQSMCNDQPPMPLVWAAAKP